MSALTLARDGAELHPGLASNGLAALATLFGDDAAPGRRIDTLDVASEWVGQGSDACALASAHIGAPARPVRAIAFDKRDGANWALGWHQDRVIAVRERREVPGFGPWTVKAGLPHVQPPIALLERMVTLRLHLDAVDAHNAPLRVAPGSHLEGRIEEEEIAEVVARCGEEKCLAAAGDAWLYATLILHASDRADPGRRRRVVQVDYSADTLPGGLDWSLS